MDVKGRIQSTLRKQKGPLRRGFQGGLNHRIKIRDDGPPPPAGAQNDLRRKILIDSNHATLSGSVARLGIKTDHPFSQETSCVIARVGMLSLQRQVRLNSNTVTRWMLTTHSLGGPPPDEQDHFNARLIVKFSIFKFVASFKRRQQTILGSNRHFLGKANISSGTQLR
jgi:hypothetical protein